MINEFKLKYFKREKIVTGKWFSFEFQNKITFKGSNIFVIKFVLVIEQYISQPNTKGIHDNRINLNFRNEAIYKKRP